MYSTVASALNSLSAVTSEDIIATGLNIKINPEKGSLYIKWMSLGYVAARLCMFIIISYSIIVLKIRPDFIRTGLSG